MKMQKLRETLENKAEIRRIILQKRNSLTKEEVASKSRRIQERLYSLKQFVTAKCVMAYASFRNEVNTSLIIDKCLKSGKKVFLPLVDKDSDNLIAYEIRDFLTDTAPGSFGIMEPVIKDRKRIRIDEIDICLIPGIAFDRSGNRIGWGRGYYDSFLRNLPARAGKYGLAYDFQLIERIMSTDKDVPINGLITESEILLFKD